ncbi:MAG TPA: hypothetical protein VNQ90_03810 [Chthoniobacteraceae bacterium]|nr:hypothetical protein [Chthoniobacteraceae bacterium]
MAHWKKRETLFSQYGFEVTLPGHWQSRESGDADRWIYRSADRKEQLTLSRGESIGAEDEPARQRVIVRQRRAIELGFDRLPDLHLSEPELLEHSGVVAARFEGSADQERLVFSSLLLFEQESVWTLFHEALKLQPEEAHRRAGEIFLTARFPAPTFRVRRR